MNDVWGKWWWGDWELVLLDDGHAGEALMVLALWVLLMVLVLVLLVYR